MSPDGQGTKWRRNVAENFNRLSRVHERYGRQTDDRRTDDDIERERNVCSLRTPVWKHAHLLALAQ